MSSTRTRLFTGPVNRWLMVAMGAVGVSLGAGTIMIYAFGLLSVAMLEEFGWEPRIAIQLMTAFLFGSGLGLMLLGWAISRFGIRLPSALLALLFGLSFMAVAVVPPSLPLLVTLFVVIGIGGAACTVLPYAVAISGFFDRHRGLALGIVVAGSGAGAIFLPQMAVGAIERWGWQGGFVLIGLLAGPGAAAIVTLFVRTPAGAVAKSGAGEGERPRPLARMVLTNRRFWLIFAPIFAVSVGTFGGMGSIVLLLKSKGLDDVSIAAMLSIVGASSWAARLLAGFLLDRLFAPFLTASVLLLAAVGLIALLYTGSPAALLLATICVSVAMGCEADLLTFLVSRYFPLVEFSRVTSYLWVVWAWSGMIGGMAVSYSLGSTGGYDLAFWTFAAALLIGALCISRIGPYLNPVDAHGSAAA